MNDKFIVQMYSLRKEFELDPDMTLKIVKELGFNKIQFDGLRGHDALYIAELLKKHQLKVVGIHMKHDYFLNNKDMIIRESSLFDCKLIYNKYIEDVDQNTKGYAKTKKAMIDIATTLAPLGYQIGLHNPEYDFNNKIDDLRVMDYFCKPVNGISIYPECDTYWIKVAGHDPLDYLKKYPYRLPIIHLKDLDSNLDLNDYPNNICTCGQGCIDFESIIRWGEEYGVEYYAIEIDHSKEDMFKAIKDSYDYLDALYQKIILEK